MSDTVQPTPSTYASVSTAVELASAQIHRHDPDDGREPFVSVSFTAHMTNPKGISCWTASLKGANASDLLALLAPVVDQLRQMAADELVERAPTLDEFIKGVVSDCVEGR